MIKTVLCQNYHNNGWCKYGYKCTYEHDKQKLIDISNERYEIIYKNYILNDDVKIILTNIKNYNIIIKYYDNENKLILITTLIAVITTIINKLNVYSIGVQRIFNENNRSLLNEILTNYMCETCDINYLISICILLYVTDEMELKFINKCPIYNRMFRGLLLSINLKAQYADSYLKYITLNSDNKCIYNYMQYLNDKALKITLNKENDDKIFNMYKLYNIDISNEILQYQIKRNICNDKQLITKIVKCIDNVHHHKDFKCRLLNCILSNINENILTDVDYVLSLMSYNSYITNFININKYISNIKFVKQILFKNIYKYAEIENDHKNISIISIGCNINLKKIPLEDVLKAYSNYIYLMINKRIGGIEYIYVNISKYILCPVKIFEQYSLHKTRMNMLYDRYRYS